MSRNKSKKPTPEHPRVLKARHKKDYLSRLKMVCDRLGGTGWFELIPAADLDLIYEKRYPPLSIRMAVNDSTDKSRWERYCILLQAMLDNPSVVGSESAPIPIKTMHSEGLTLLHFIAMMNKGRFPGSEELRKAFRPYLMTEQSQYSYLKDELIQLLFIMDVRSGNYHDGFLQADSSQILLCFFNL